MNITTEEIERLMRVVSEPLRTRWEVKNFNSNSLLDLQRSRERAVAIAGYYRAGIERWQKINIALMFVAFVGLFFTLNIWSLAVILIMVAIVGAQIYWARKVRELEESTFWHDSTFTNFHRAVESLNPYDTGNTYHDIITEEVVKERLIGFAYRILHAESEFDRCRQRPEAKRYDIIPLGNWVEKCQASFEKIWGSATRDFGLELDKSGIFKNAEAQLERTQATAPSS